MIVFFDKILCSFNGFIFTLKKKQDILCFIFIHTNTITIDVLNLVLFKQQILKRKKC